MDGPSERPGLIAGVVVEAGLGVAGWLLLRGRGHDPLALLRADPAAILAGVAATVPLAAFALWAARTQAPAVARLRADLVDLMGPFLRGTSPLGLLLLALAAGFGEEVLFRGFVQTELIEWVGVPAALLLASLLFGLLHPISGLYVALAAGFGACFGGLALATGGLVAPIVAHALYDFAALLLLRQQARAGTGERS